MSIVLKRVDLPATNCRWRIIYRHYWIRKVEGLYVIIYNTINNDNEDLLPNWVIYNSNKKRVATGVSFSKSQTIRLVKNSATKHARQVYYDFIFHKW